MNVCRALEFLSRSKNSKGTRNDQRRCAPSTLLYLKKTDSNIPKIGQLIHKNRHLSIWSVSELTDNGKKKKCSSDFLSAFNMNNTGSFTRTMHQAIPLCLWRRSGQSVPSRVRSSSVLAWHSPLGLLYTSKLKRASFQSTELVKTKEEVILSTTDRCGFPTLLCTVGNSDGECRKCQV